jgi:hypothetical protein
MNQQNKRPKSKCCGAVAIVLVDGHRGICGKCGKFFETATIEIVQVTDDSIQKEIYPEPQKPLRRATVDNTEAVEKMFKPLKSQPNRDYSFVTDKGLDYDTDTTQPSPSYDVPRNSAGKSQLEQDEELIYRLLSDTTEAIWLDDDGYIRMEFEDETGTFIVKKTSFKDLLAAQARVSEAKGRREGTESVLELQELFMECEDTRLSDELIGIRFRMWWSNRQKHLDAVLVNDKEDE